MQMGRNPGLYFIPACSELEFFKKPCLQVAHARLVDAVFMQSVFQKRNGQITLT